LVGSGRWCRIVSARRPSGLYDADHDITRREDAMSSFYDFKMTSITGESVGLDKFRDQVNLIVNVATE
jgi:hypothetical protein